MQPKKKNTLRAYFTFNARERRAMLLLIFLITIFFIAPHLIPNLVKPIAEDQKQRGQIKTDTDSFQNRLSNNKVFDHSYDLQKKVQPAKLYPFNPNTISTDQWKAFGVREKTAETIKKYLQKGGCFNKPEDLRKIWGLSDELVNQLMPYVIIPASVHEVRKESFNSKSVKAKQIDINVASQEEWESFRGIGSGLAGRIIKFRDRLGGFTSIEQVGQTFGLPDSTFQQIKSQLHIGVTPVRLLNINQLSVEDLGKHPYIGYKTARTILQFRQQHGNYHSVQELKKIESLTTEDFHRMEPYLTIE